MSKLTKFPEGGVRELLSIAFPLMFSALSVNLMMFLDRLILANYSITAMNAAVSAGMVCAMFQFGAIGISSIAEVFVGQYNGAGKKAKLGEPVWQMLWFSLFTASIFWPFAQFGATWLVPSEFHTDGIPYYQWIMVFGPVVPAIAALSAFFIGQGKTRLVLASTIIGNALNLVLDLIFVFGIENLLQPMGARGAAIATVFSQGAQVLILFTVFLSKGNCKSCGTAHLAFRVKAFLKCLKIGTPNAIGHMIAIGALAYLIHLMASVGSLHITVFAVGQTIFVVFAFTLEGMQKAVISVAANFIGAKKPDYIKKMIGSSIKIQAILAGILVIPLLLFPNPLIDIFIKEGTAGVDIAELVYYLKIAFAWIFVFFFFDGVTWSFAGVLTAGGDTRFIMIMNVISAWAFNIVPFYFFVVIGGKSPAWLWGLAAFYSVANSVAFYLRYRTHKWKSKLAIVSAHELAPGAT